MGTKNKRVPSLRRANSVSRRMGKKTGARDPRSHSGSTETSPLGPPARIRPDDPDLETVWGNLKFILGL